MPPRAPAWVRLAGPLLTLPLLACPPAPPPPGGPRFTVRLVRPGADPGAVIAALTSLGRARPVAEGLVSHAPVPVLVAVERAEAERARAALVAAGAEVVVGEVPR